MSPDSQPIQISSDEILTAIERSGYPLEQRVRKVLDRHAYFVEANVAFPDPQTGISRELDISAMRAVKLSQKGKDFLFPFLLCECENNSLPVVFFDARPQVPALYHEEVKLSGTPVKIWTGRHFVRISEFLNFETFHHYCRPPIATQYCGFSRKNSNAPWIASHADQHHNTLENLVNALEAEISDHYGVWTMPERIAEEPINIQLYYPLLILQGEIYLARERNRKLTLRKVPHVQYRRDKWSHQLRDTYQIDVVQERFIPTYLDLVEKEIETFKKRLSRHLSSARTSVTRLIKQARATRKRPRPWREIFEP
jgi:hypothetical protein